MENNQYNCFSQYKRRVYIKKKKSKAIIEFDL